MSVLTEITNSDKDILLSGDCTIKTKLITSKERLPVQIYDGIYDSENDSYYILGESTQETRSGKNLFDLTDGTYSHNGITAIVNNGEITLNGTATANSFVSIPVSKNYNINIDETITVSLNNATENNYCSLRIDSPGLYDTTTKSKNSVRTMTISTTLLSSSITIRTGSGGSYTNYSIKPQLEKGSTATDWEQFGVMPSPDYPSEVKSISGTIGVRTKEDTVVVVDLEDNELCGITVKDKLTIKDGKATITKNIGEKTFKGADNETFVYLSNNYSCATVVPNIKQAVASTFNQVLNMSNYFNGISRDDFSNNIHNKIDLGTCVWDSANYLLFKYPSLFTTVGTFKTWLSTHNTSVYYELATPQEITLTNVNTYTIQTLTEENSVKDWTISDDRYVENNGVIGQFVARDISGNLQNISDDFNIENNYVQVQMGISQFNSNITNWYSLGSFLITKPSDDEVIDNTKYNGYDLATLFNIDFNPKYVNEDFPKSFNQMLEEQKYVTNKWLANYVCAQAEVELATQDFIHNDFQVLSNQFTSGESCRDIMRYIAQLAFGYCEIGWDDKCYIRTLSNDYSSFDDYHKLNYDTYYNLETQKNEYGPINRVFCGLQDVDGQGKENIDKSTIENGVTTINIYNNPLTMGTTLEISEQLRAQVVKDCGVLWGIKYRPITNMETIGHPWFKANEPIQVSDMENKTFITYPFNNTLKYTGHIKSEISSEGNTKSEDTYGYKDSVERRMNRIGINVDRANEKITIINQKITKIGDDIEDIRGNMLEIGDVYTKSEIRDIVSGVGVDGTVVTSVETATTIFDINGMTVGRTDSPTKTNINSNGMIITNANDNTELLKINNSGVYSENLTARTYLNFGTHGRFEKYTENNRTRIGCFWIEGDD